MLGYGTGWTDSDTLWLQDRQIMPGYCYRIGILCQNMVTGLTYYVTILQKD